MKSVALLSSLAFVGAENFVQGGTLNLKWSDCGDASTKGKVTGLTPSTLTLGVKTTATGTGTCTEDITAGTFEIDLKASIISQTFKGDVCAAKTFSLPLGTGSLTWDGIKCPAAAGGVSIPVDISLSASLPSSLATVKMTIKSVATSGDKLLCMEIDTSPALAVPPPNYLMKWRAFKTAWPKTYADEKEEKKRWEIFKTNVDIIYEENAKEWHSHQLGLTEFADMTKDEFSSMYLGYKPELKNGNLATVPWVSPNIVAPASIDWVAKGAVTPVKNQGQCGSCWAFSTTGSTEGAMFVASGKLVSLSEEDLVQCDHNGDRGWSKYHCGAGRSSMDSAFTWIKSNGGIASESKYPYTSGKGTTGKCKKNFYTSVVTISGHTDVPTKNEDALKLAVAQQPVSVAIQAYSVAFQHYKFGVLDSRSCGTKLDHGVLVVGYGTDGGKDYWKVKNSWGASWGEKGYIRMVRGKNMCGIAMQPSYPTGAKAVGAIVV